jgi:hypothetical protein
MRGYRLEVVRDGRRQCEIVIEGSRADGPLGNVQWR